MIQLSLVGLLVALAVAYLVWQTVRTWTGGASSCGGGCKCPTQAKEPAKPKLISSDELLQRMRGD